MRQNIGIYASNDWREAKAYADNLRKECDCTVRLRDGASFTADQVEPFTQVLVRGDWPAVLEAYPNAKRIDDKPVETAKVVEQVEQVEQSKRGPGRPRK